ncbi:unnamed protein product [Urochloa humidicola]
MADLVFGLAKSAVEGTLTMARSAIEEEEKLQKSVQRELMLISDEFEMMHAFLSATKERATDEMTRTLVRQVRNTALDVEDCIESVVHMDNRSNYWRRLLPSCMSASAPAASLDAAVADLELLKARVEAMGQRNVRYGLISKPATETTPQKSAAGATKQLDILVEARNPLNKRSSPRDLAELIGMHREDGSSESISNGDGTHQLRVISVWGTGGDLGTTSIVKKAYDNPEIGNDFVCRAWVRLTRPFNPREFIRSLLAQFYTNKLGSTRTPDLLKPAQVMAAAEDTVVKEFTKQVNDCRYLVVLEDVSTMFDWESIRVFLPDMGNGSRVVVHTRQLEVASLCVGHSQRVVELERLSDDHSICAFFNDDENSKGDEETAKIESAREWLEGFQRVGRQTNFWALRSKIMDDTIRCIPVCGIVGVGKSSLVRQVYCEAMVAGPGLFQKFGWVDVPNPFNLRELSRNLLLDVHSGSLQRASMLRIKDSVRECRGLLQHYRCLTVINGLQSTEEWDSIKADLAGHSHQSLIIVIAHEESVARYCSNENWFHVEGLEFEEALDLFKITVSKKIGPCALSHQVMKKTNRILPMCGGLPKVIIAVAEFVADILNNDEGCWCHLGDSFMEELEELEHPAFGSLRSLFAWARSYFRSCPDFLKPCVFYLSIFPLNHRIRRRRLVRRWVAEGYARDDEDSGAEENAEEFFFKLFLLSIIQVPGQRVLSNHMRMPLCQINGFLREYMVSRSMEDNLIFSLEDHCSATSQRTGRHLTVARSWDRDWLVFRSIDFSRLRSLTVFGRWEPFFVSNKMGLLRVLDLEDASGVTDKDVDRMLQLLPRLKFLSLRGCEGVTRLPDSFLGGMRHLQTLDIRYTSIVTLPPSITKLSKLQYIRAGTNVPVFDDDNTDSFTATVEIPPPPSSEAATKAATPLSSPSGPTTSTSRPPTAAAKTPVVSRIACSELWTRCCHRHLAVFPNGGVVLPRGIGKMMALHTLGIIDVSGATGRANLKELKHLTQLRKFGVSGVSEQNCPDLCSAISGHVQLESLSLRLDRGSRGCLNGISSPPEYLDSLKLYGDTENELPSWTNQLNNLTKLSLKMATVTQQGMDVLAHLSELRALRLHLKEFQDGELRFMDGFDDLEILEVACNSRLRAVTFCHGVMKVLELLKLHCYNMSSIRFSGLEELMALNEVWLSGSYTDELKEHLNSQLQGHKRGANLVPKETLSS